MTTNTTVVSPSSGLIHPAYATGGPVAVMYLRVSTKEQAEKGGTDEGYSIPAQREANLLKAEALGATVIEEFVDAGESARKADRPQLMKMIEYVTAHQVNYCIVHKVDRLARNRADDVAIHLALRDAGVTLVSASENIDETPSGMLLHGIMSSIAEFYSRNLATETVKGLSQKAAQGGTTNRAPIGYLNVGVRDERGRENRTVVLDEERAPLVRWAFEQFASGRWTLSQMQRELEARGLTTPPTPKRASKPLGKTSVQRMLTNPYYLGMVRFKGAVYPGSHEALVPKEVWYQVQNVLESHISAADATQLHAHYLKGTIYCGACGSRFIIVNANNGKGKIYPYFVCNGRHSKKTGCTRQAILIEDVERMVEKYYETIQISADLRQSLAGMIHAEFDRLLASDSGELEALAKERASLEEERLVVLRAHYSGAISLELLKEEQMRIEARLDDIKGRLSAHHDEYAAARANLDDCLALLANISLIYSRCDNQNRRLCNQAFFRKIFIDEDREVKVEYQPSYEALCDVQSQANALNWAATAKKKDEVQTFSRVETLVEGLNLAHMGWLTGLEPATPATTTRCSTS